MYLSLHVVVMSSFSQSNLPVFSVSFAKQWGYFHSVIIITQLFYCLTFICPQWTHEVNVTMHTCTVCKNKCVYVICSSTWNSNIHL